MSFTAGMIEKAASALAWSIFWLNVTLIGWRRSTSMVCDGLNFLTMGAATLKAWKDIWGCGQGIGAVNKVQSAGAYVAQLRREYEAARARLLSPATV